VRLRIQAGQPPRRGLPVEQLVWPQPKRFDATRGNLHEPRTRRERGDRELRRGRGVPNQVPATRRDRGENTILQQLLRASRARSRVESQDRGVRVATQEHHAVRGIVPRGGRAVGQGGDQEGIGRRRRERRAEDEGGARAGLYAQEDAVAAG